ncbi:MAG: hypothetical protein AAF900_01995, partial [Bacteroidota bacterium]
MPTKKEINLSQADKIHPVAKVKQMGFLLLLSQFRFLFCNAQHLKLAIYPAVTLLGINLTEPDHHRLLLVSISSMILLSSFSKIFDSLIYGVDANPLFIY